MRFAYFVDGSNLFGLLKELDVRVPEYESFFDYLHGLSVDAWRSTVIAPADSAALMQRVYWYVVGSMDQWDLANPKAQVHLKDRFDRDSELNRPYFAQVGRDLAAKGHVGDPHNQDRVAKDAWAAWFEETKEWYIKKQDILSGMMRFHHGVRSGTDGIDIIDCGRWKVDLMYRSLEEKGLDTRLAVDMVALEANYDVGVVLTGDADMIPSIDLMKRRGKHVGVFEFHKGYPPEHRGRAFSSHLRLSADFVVHVYEMDLTRNKIGTKGQASPSVFSGDSVELSSDA